MSPKKQKFHHNLASSVLEREDNSIDQLLTTLRNFTDPFKEDGNELFNLVTKVIMPKKVRNNICERGEIAKKLFETFVTDRIKMNRVNLWSPMKRRKLLTWKDSEKVLKLSCKDKVIELKEDRSLFARLIAVCKSRPEINIKEVIGQYEFSVAPRSLFAPDGTMLHCSAESALMTILVKLDGKSEQRTTTGPQISANESVNMEPSSQMRVAVVNAMTELQPLRMPDVALHKPELTENKLRPCDLVI